MKLSWFSARIGRTRIRVSESNSESEKDRANLPDLWMHYESVSAWFIQWLSNLKRTQLKRIAWAHVGALQGPTTSRSSSSTIHPKAAAIHERRMVSRGSKYRTIATLRVSRVSSGACRAT